MPCMCGDTYCGSCGPAQGNYRCPACGTWSFDSECKDPKACEEKIKEMEKDEEEFWRICEENEQ